MILVIGGRSKIGSAVIGELNAKKEAVRALVRSGGSGAAFPAAVETVTGDLADPDSLRPAIAGADRVFLLCSPTENEVELNRNAIDVAKDEGVRLLVRCSMLGASPDSAVTFFRNHGAIDTYLQESGVPNAVVRPNPFLQNVSEQTIPSIDGDGNFYANAGDARISMVDTRDIAAVAATLLTAQGHEGSAYDVTGPEALSLDDVATALTKLMGRKITYVDAPDDAVHAALLGLGLGEWRAGALVDLYQEYRRSGTDGYAAHVTDTVERMTGRAPRSLDQLLAEQARP